MSCLVSATVGRTISALIKKTGIVLRFSQIHQITPREFDIYTVCKNCTPCLYFHKEQFIPFTKHNIPPPMLTRYPPPGIFTPTPTLTYFTHDAAARRRGGGLQRAWGGGSGGGLLRHRNLQMCGCERSLVMVVVVVMVCNDFVGFGTSVGGQGSTAGAPSTQLVENKISS